MAEAGTLNAVLQDIGEVAVAVSGGVDSVTLAVAAQRCLGERASMIHAVSPAVPPEATARVRTLADREGWRLDVIDAGEFDDPNYVRNPANRCFFCKTNLYGTMTTRTQATVVSGTNLDDLGDYRPGLLAARDHGVRHPYVEAAIDKAGVRALARRFGLDDIAELPAAPCLSSRLETGLVVTTARLQLVHAVERLVQDRLSPDTVRCRLFHEGVIVQLDPGGLAEIERDERADLRQAIADLAAAAGPGDVRYQPYRMGSAFHRPSAHAP